MKCYYEILEVPRNAEESEIKVSYRKLALKWHPDKNLDNSELAKEQFQLVQQAYEVLSDRQERAWYDNHREQILRGSNSEYEDNSLCVFPYFTTQCFKGYGDDEQGFYTVYRQVFEKISNEDIEYMDSKSDFDEIPGFGYSTSDYDDIVGPFYSYWMSYTTKKSYVWLDPYNIKETRDRRVVKLIEKENKKVRQKARKERNEEIRNLVAFVRKRDKRMQTYIKQLEIKTKENREKQEVLRKQKLLERQEELKCEKSQAEWSKFDNVKYELKQIEKSLAAEFGEDISDSDVETEEEDVIDPNNLYCPACNKVFKTPKAFGNHESSKKHKENVAKLKIKLQEDDIEEISHDDLIDSDISSDDELYCEPCNKSFKTSKALENHENSKKHLENTQKIDTEENSNDTSQSFEVISESEITIEAAVSKASTKKAKKNKKVMKIHLENTSDLSDTEMLLINDLNSTDFDSDFNSKPAKKQTKKNKNKSQTVINKNPNEENAPQPIDEDIVEVKNKKIKKTKVAKNKVEIDVEDIDVSLSCAVCKSTFDSKNKLFQHLKKTNHQVAIPDSNVKNKKKIK